ncbi:MAG: AMP-dependent synthetase/ligase [Solirubrobacteraceae bacterium]
MAAALGARSLCEAFQITAAANAQRPALRSPDDSFALSWGEYAERVKTIAAGLAALGVGDGDTVALLLGNRSEFHLLDTATLHLGAAPFSIYHTNPPEQIVPLLANSGARVMITEPMFLERARATRELHPAIEHVVVVGVGDGDLLAGELTLSALEERGAAALAGGFDFEASWRAVTPDHVATLVYTSGTTGTPKGVEHTHGGLVFGLGCLQRLAPVSPEGRVVSFLPNAHIAERYISHYSSLAFGYTITGCADPKQLPAAVGGARPTRLFGVPRIYEKFGVAAKAVIDGDPTGVLGSAYAAGLARVRAIQSGAPVDEVPTLSSDDEAALGGLRAKLGLDQLEWAGVAAAPTPYSVLEFFHAIGVNIAELWGMSECVLSTSNPPARVKLGTVGVAIPGVEIRLADDGEILVRGPNVTRQYRGDPAKTAEAIDADGWLHSGDIAVADEDGYLKIVDRKKELIINSAGKNMAPTHIECTIKEESPLIGQVIAIGDGRQYVTALIVLDDEASARLAQQQGLPAEIAELASSAVVTEAIAEAVARGNERLARVEQVKAFRILGEFWAPGGDQLTPTMKLKRRVIDKLYADAIEGLYS